VSSLIETIRDILRRAYGTPATQGLLALSPASTGVIVGGGVALLLLALFAQVAITAAQEVIAAWFPRLGLGDAGAGDIAADPGAVLYLRDLSAVLHAHPHAAYRAGAIPNGRARCW
jgi:membrane protein